MPAGAAMHARPPASVTARNGPSATSTCGMGAAVAASITVTVRRCSGRGTTANPNAADEPSCGGLTSVAASRALQEKIPARGGATSTISVQKSAPVPGHGTVPSRPRPTPAPASSKISTRAPLSE